MLHQPLIPLPANGIARFVDVVKQINLILLSLSVYVIVGGLLYLVLKIHRVSLLISNADTNQLEQCVHNLSLLCSNL